MKLSLLSLWDTWMAQLYRETALPTIEVHVLVKATTNFSAPQTVQYLQKEMLPKNL